MKNLLSAVLACFAIFEIIPNDAHAGLVKLYGYYEFRTDINQEEGSFSPNIRTQDRADRGAKNYFEGRLLADPTPGVNLYAKLQLDSKDAADQLKLGEGSLYLKKEFSGKGFEWILFESQERFFMNDPLLEVTQGKSDLRGVRANLWAWNGWINFYQGKLKADGGADDNNDVYAMRMGRNFFAKNRLTLAGTTTSKVWSTGKNNVGAMDATLRFGDAELIAAGAASHTTDITKRDPTLFQSELRNLRWVTRRLGSLRLTSAYRNWGDGYRNYVGKNPDKKEDGIYNELVYEFPLKAMRFTFRSDLKEETRRTVADRPERRTKYWYGETFLEFAKGYKAKFYYDVYNDPWNGNLSRPNVFFQIESFSRFNTLKTQIKFKDYSNRYQKTLFGVENRHTFTENLFFIVRTLHAFEDEPDLIRNSLFVQLRYKVKDNGNVFLEFGNNDHGNDDLTNDGFFADNATANTDRLTKVVLQVWW